MKTGKVLLPLEADSLAYFRKLDNEIWGYAHDWRHGRPATRELTEEEFYTIIGLIESYQLPTEMHSFGAYGGFIAIVYDHSYFPSSPPERALSFSSGHVPGSRRIKSNEIARPLSYAFKRCESFTHSEENKRILAFYSLEEPGPLNNYEY